MLKLAIIGTVAVLASATHPVTEDIVTDIKSKNTSWIPMEVHENPLHKQSEEAVRQRLGTIVQGP
jgi:hypothetical protein